MEAGKGEAFNSAAIEMKVRDIVDGENENYVWRHAKIDVSQNGKHVRHAGARAARL